MRQYFGVLLIVFSLGWAIADETVTEGRAVNTEMTEETDERTQETQKTEEGGEKKEKAKDATGGLLGPLSLGPVISIIGFPTLGRIGMEGRMYRFLGIAFDYGIFPQLTLFGYQIALNSWRVVPKIYPFGGSIYLGAGIGAQNFVGETNTTINSVNVHYRLDVTTFALTPHLGWRWGDTQGGFFTGMEIGLQLPLSAVSNLTTDASEVIQNTDAYKSGKANIEAQGNIYGRALLPWLAMVQFGFLF